MKNIETIKALVTSSNIKVKDLSDSTMKRLRVVFPNGLGISIIHGKHSYGGDQGLYEIAPLNKDNDLDGSILGLDDDVEGYLSEDEVIERCQRIAKC